MLSPLSAKSLPVFSVISSSLDKETYGLFYAEGEFTEESLPPAMKKLCEDSFILGDFINPPMLL